MISFFFFVTKTQKQFNGYIFHKFQIQVSGLVSENQKLQEKVRSSTDSHQRATRSLESRVVSLQADLDLSRSELVAVQAEYDSYKVSELLYIKY